MKGVFSPCLSFVSLTAAHDVLCGSQNIPEGSRLQYKHAMALSPSLDRCPEGTVGPGTSPATETQRENEAGRPGVLGLWPMWV